MRIVVVSPPRSGNHWVKCLLGAVYGLNTIGGELKPGTNRRGFNEAIDAGAFPDGTILHQHGRFSRDVADQLEALPAHLVTVMRDPYDAFVSYFEWVQSRYAQRVRKSGDASDLETRPRHAMFGKAIDDPEVLVYLRDGFAVNLRRANQWFHSGRSIVVRFEDLHADPAGELARLTERIEPIGRDRLDEAVEFCRVENVKQRNANLAATVRSGNVGESRTRLGEEHLRIMREVHGPSIASLGYRVR